MFAVQNDLGGGSFDPIHIIVTRGLYFGPENGANIFLGNVCKCLPIIFIVTPLRTSYLGQLSSLLYLNVSLREEHVLKVPEIRILRRIY
jgi:hypothetical protein